MIFYLKRVEAVGLVEVIGYTYPGWIQNTYVVTTAFEKLREFLNLTDKGGPSLAGAPHFSPGPNVGAHRVLDRGYHEAISAHR